MTTTLLSYLRLIIFTGGLLAGIQLPAYVDQYGKSLQAHYLEAELALDEFRDEARKFFGGDLDRLIAHYHQSNDKVFNEGGNSIEAVRNRTLLLQQSLHDFKSSAFNAYKLTFLTPVADIQQEVRQNFSHTITLQPQVIVFGLCSGLLLAVFCELLFKGVFALFRKILPAQT